MHNSAFKTLWILMGSICVKHLWKTIHKAVIKTISSGKGSMIYTVIPQTHICCLWLVIAFHSCIYLSHWLACFECVWPCSVQGYFSLCTGSHKLCVITGRSPSFAQTICPNKPFIQFVSRHSQGNMLSLIRSLSLNLSFWMGAPWQGSYVWIIFFQVLSVSGF